jgi:predicted ATPase
VSTTSLIGRKRAIGEVARLLGRPRVRLVTLTGPGGVGKTRLAVAVGERLRGRFGAGTVLVALEAITDPGLVLAAIGRAAGADMARTGSPLAVLAETFGDGAWLLVLDNLEQVVQVAPDLGELLARCPGLAILATSRTALGLRAEREYPVPPLQLPAGPGAASLAEVAASPAVALFVDRARAVRPGFALTDGNAGAVAEICRRLEGLPLAIELAAARTRLLDPPALLDQLVSSLDALGTGAVDLPERQRSLRATVEWSAGLLEDPERSLLEVAAVFVDGWTIQALAQVAGLDEVRALELSEALAQHSLVYLDSTGLGSRTRMLETVREFVAERLAVRPDAAEVGRRHAGYYRALAEQADRPLRSPGQSERLERLQAEAGNLAAAVRWYLAHDPGPLPHLSRVLWLFWTQEDLEREAWSWVQQLLPASGTLDPQARAELAWAAAVLAVDTGTTRRRWPPASAWRRCWPGSPTPSCTRWPSWRWRGPRRSPVTLRGRCGRRRSRWRNSKARMSPYSWGWPRSPPARWRWRWAATTRRCPTCVRRVTWPTESAATGSPRAPECSWASWLSCGAGSMRPGRCWRRRWTSAWRPAAPRS